MSTCFLVYLFTFVLTSLALKTRVHPPLGRAGHEMSVLVEQWTRILIARHAGIALDGFPWMASQLPLPYQMTYAANVYGTALGHKPPLPQITQLE